MDFKFKISDLKFLKIFSRQNFMKNYTIAILISSVIFTACGTPAPTNTNSANAANSAQNQTAANTNSNANSTANSIANSTAPSALSPTETMKALNEAAKKKDTAAIKKFVSKGTLALMEDRAKEQGTTLDELLKSDEGTPFDELPEMRNENIVGEKATLEVKDTSEDEWTTLPFVKEDGVWKIALDEYVEELEQRMLEEMKKPPAKTGKETGADKKETNANKAANK